MLHALQPEVRGSKLGQGSVRTSGRRRADESSMKNERKESKRKEVAEKGFNGDK